MKVCGLTTRADALQALAAGADALGFVFHPGSPRSLDLDAYLDLLPALPPWASTVAVFTTKDADRVEDVVTLGGFPAYQVHGPLDGPAPEVRGRSFWRAFDPGRDPLDAAREHLAGGPHRRVLLDPRAADGQGGTGRALDDAGLADWVALPGAVLAGGLGPDNVEGRVRRLRPAGVDASSRLESSPGVKDHDLVTRYVAAARRGAAGPGG